MCSIEEQAAAGLGVAVLLVRAAAGGGFFWCLGFTRGDLE